MKKIHKAGKMKAGHRVPLANINSDLTMAELSLQRGEFESARMLLKERIIRGNSDFKTKNLYAISMAHVKNFDDAENVFLELWNKSGNKLQRAKAGFNLGLARFLRELNQTGDLTVSHFNTLGMMRNCGSMKAGPLFAEAIETWTKALKGHKHRHDVVQAFLAFAYLQAGDYEKALEMVIKAQSAPDNFYISFYVTGRLFLDMYYLSLEGHFYYFPEEAIDFFEVEDYEIAERKGEYAIIHPETLLDIAMQAFLEARSQRSLCAEVMLNLCHAYLLAGMPDETEETLAQLDIMLPNHVAVLELALRFHQSVLSPTSLVQGLVNRIKDSLGKDPDQQRQHIIPAYFQI